MSTLIYSVRDDTSRETRRSEQDRRRVSLVIILVAVAIGPGVFLVHRLVGTVAWRSFLVEALSLCLYAAVAVWYGLRRHLGTAWRVALAVYLIGLAVMGLVGLITKRGLSALLVDSPRASDAILLAGAPMLLFLPLLGWIAWRYPIEMDQMGFSLVYPLSRLGLYVLVGAGIGAVIGIHFWLTAKATGVDLEPKPWPYVVWQLFYEIGPQSLTEELFMRGVVFNELHFSRNWNFWAAAFTVSGLQLLSLLVKEDYGTGILVFAGVLFYSVVSGVASAGLFRWSRSVIPGYVNNVVFGFVSVFR